MVQNIENIDFRTFLTVTSQQWSLLKGNYEFWVPLNISDQVHRIVQSCFIFQENAQNLQK